MKIGPVLVATLFAVTSFPLLARQAPPDSTSASPAMQPSSPPGAQPEQSAPDNQPSASPAASPSSAPGEQPGNSASPATNPDAAAAAPDTASTTTAAPAEMRPVQAQLVNKLDTKTAKTGDDVVVETRASVKTADGTEIPKGSRLVGRVVAVQPSAGGTNSQVALQFDHAELKGGQNLPIHSEIQSIEPAGGDASVNESAGLDHGAISGPPAGAAGAGAPGAANSMGSARSNPGYAPGTVPETAGNGEPAAGTVVAKTGNITIKATSVPGVLLANNAPGQQDPRMAQASSILLGAKKDVTLEGGTLMVLAVATVPGGGTQ